VCPTTRTINLASLFRECKKHTILHFYDIFVHVEGDNWDKKVRPFSRRFNICW